MEKMTLVDRLREAVDPNRWSHRAGQTFAVLFAGRVVTNRAEVREWNGPATTDRRSFAHGVTTFVESRRMWNAAPAALADEVIDVSGFSDVAWEKATAAGAIIVGGDYLAANEDLAAVSMDTAKAMNQPVTLRNGQVDDRFLALGRLAESCLKSTAGVAREVVRMIAEGSTGFARERAELAGQHAESARWVANLALGHMNVNDKHRPGEGATESMRAELAAIEAEGIMADLMRALELAERLGRVD